MGPQGFSSSLHPDEWYPRLISFVEMDLHWFQSPLDLFAERPQPSCCFILAAYISLYICIYLYIWSPIFVAKLPSLIALSSPHQKSGSTQLPPGQCHARLRSAPPFVLLDAVASWQDGVKRPERQTGDLWKKIAIIRRGYTVCLYVCMSVCLFVCLHACMHACIHVCIMYKLYIMSTMCMCVHVVRYEKPYLQELAWSWAPWCWVILFIPTSFWRESHGLLLHLKPLNHQEPWIQGLSSTIYSCQNYGVTKLVHFLNPFFFRNPPNFHPTSPSSRIPILLVIASDPPWGNPFFNGYGVKNPWLTKTFGGSKGMVPSIEFGEHPCASKCGDDKGTSNSCCAWQSVHGTEEMSGVYFWTCYVDSM